MQRPLPGDAAPVADALGHSPDRGGLPRRNLSGVKLLFSDIDWQGKWRPETVATAEIELKVLPFTLPEQQLLRYEWFHADCLSAYYRVPAWSEEHWRIVENFVHNAVSHGINVLYVPLWTPPLDTEIGGERPTCQLLDVHVEADGAYRFGFEKLERYLEMGKRLGVKRFGISHLVTQWGAEFTPKIVETLGGGRDRKLFGWHVGSDDPAFKAFLTALMPQLLAVLRRHGLTGRCFFSISDEPSVEHLETYRSVVEWIVPLLEDFPTVEALSSFDFYQNGLVRNPVPCNNHIEPFVGHVKELWTYYCCSQEDRVPNRCMAMPSRRNRIMGLLAYVYDLTGFLQWGFNFYFSQYSKRLIDPFACTDAGGAFPAGDPFMVYPGRIRRAAGFDPARGVPRRVAGPARAEAAGEQDRPRRRARAAERRSGKTALDDRIPAHRRVAARSTLARLRRTGGVIQLSAPERKPAGDTP